MPTRLAVIVSLALAACDRQTPEQAAASQAALTAAKDTCVKVFQKQRACTDTYIPALVDLRRELDRPKGISEASRDELIPMALEEWKSDSTDDSIASMCDHVASDTSLNVTEGNRCLTLSGCGEFVQCVMPMMRAHLSR